MVAGIRFQRDRDGGEPDDFRRRARAMRVHYIEVEPIPLRCVEAGRFERSAAQTEFVDHRELMGSRGAVRLSDVEEEARRMDRVGAERAAAERGRRAVWVPGKAQGGRD